MSAGSRNNDTVSRDETDEKASISSLSRVQATSLGSSNSSARSDSLYYVPDLEYTREEEAKIIRILDMRLFPWILLTTFVLNMDRTNNSNAISDNLPADLGFNINVVNTATAVYSVLFTVFCFSGAVIAKIVGPSRCKFILLTTFNANMSIIQRDSNSHVLLGISYSRPRTHSR